MKIDRLETHDRLLHYNKQWEAISQGCLDCINNVPDAVKFPFYVFAHPRTVETDEKIDLILRANFTQKNVPTTRLLWTPRVTKPKAQTNSYLFMAQKGTDIIKVIWMLPPPEMWKQYAPGQMTYNEDVWNSIQNYLYSKKRLEEPEPDGPTKKNEEDFRRIISQEAKKRRYQQEQELKLKQEEIAKQYQQEALIL